MSRLTAFEVQCYNGGSWVIQSIFDDKELALIEARRMEESGLRRQETRVVKEVYDPDLDKTRSQVIYESPMVRNQAPQESRKRPAAKQPPPPAGPRAAPSGKRRAPAKRKKDSGPSAVMIGMSAVGLTVVALGALYLLRMAG